MNSTSTPPQATILIASRCPHCATTLKNLETLLKSSKISKLEAINIEFHPESAQAAGVRSVPWTRIGAFELHGAQSETDLGRWAQFAGENGGHAEYIQELLNNQRLSDAVKFVRDQAEAEAAVIDLLADPDTEMGVRIGLSALIEELENSDTLQSLTAGFISLLNSTESRVRADACHFLGLSNTPEALSAIKRCLKDDNHEVREIASEFLEP
ncbi:MAG: HEAT repeat domain-containing protein [bacterium]